MRVRYGLLWKRWQAELLELQQEMVRVWRMRDRAQVEKAQRTLYESEAARALAVRQAWAASRKPLTLWAEAEKGETGVKGGGPLNAGLVEEMREMRERLRTLSWSKGKRKEDEEFNGALEVLWGLGMAPLMEEWGDVRSYGGRPFRSVLDVAMYMRLRENRRKDKGVWVWVGGVNERWSLQTKDWMRKHWPMGVKSTSGRLVWERLESGRWGGFEEDGRVMPTPCVGTMGQMVGNWVLDGLEEVLGGEYEIVRFGRDFVVTPGAKMGTALGKLTEEEQQERAEAKVKAFLEERGLGLARQGRKGSYMEGIDFVGYRFKNVWDLQGRGDAYYSMEVTPGVGSMGELVSKVIAIVREGGSVGEINRVLREWAERYSTVRSKEEFERMDAVVGSLLPEREQGSVFKLEKVDWKHSTLCGVGNPYWPERARYYWMWNVARQCVVAALWSEEYSVSEVNEALKAQKGKCRNCGGPLLADGNWTFVEKGELSSRQGTPKVRIEHGLCGLPVSEIRGRKT